MGLNKINNWEKFISLFYLEDQIYAVEQLKLLYILIKEK